MPGLDLDQHALPTVERPSALLRELLEESSIAKQTTTIEPAIVKADFANLSSRVATALGAPNTQEPADPKSDPNKIRRNARLETAARNLFWQLNANTSIDSPDFVQVWNFLDILSILSDDGHCESALLFWLLEELLESQTISGCRKIFDYLESRRERITARFFDAKKLVILRSCNELLRRLSRAEDTTFCGRVFIFLFQSFPLGDRSSVNLRGEYHIENVTTYDGQNEAVESPMDVDAPNGSKAENMDKNGDMPLDANALYPLFWALQDTFSQPQKLFEAEHFGKFKKSLEATMKIFKTIPRGNASRAPQADELKRGVKRKRDGENGTEAGLEAFNPKYLTSKDLFELEVSDLSFRRNVLVQALIIVEFLLSLTPEFKEKLTSVHANNRSVMYSAQISEDDIKWTESMKATISDYIKSSSHDGPYFYRMVETVLARDKNWVFWKIGSCPPIKRDPVSPADFIQARAEAVRMTTNKRLRPVPMGSVPMDFLKENQEDALKELQSEERYKLPDLDSFKSKIADDDFDLDTANTLESKAAAVARKASKSWRALRIAGRFKLAAFDKIEDAKDVSAVFEELRDDHEDEVNAVACEEDMPTNREPIVISGPKGVGKTAVVQKLLEDHKGVFAVVVRHTTREPEEGDVNGKTFHFVKAPDFSQLASNDRLIENGTRDGVEYGTSTKAIDTVIDLGKVPIIELDTEAAQYAKDMGFSARFVLLKPPSNEALKERLEKAGVGAEKVTKAIEELPAQLEESKVAEISDAVIVAAEVDTTAKELSEYIYKKADGGDEVEMTDAEAEKPDE